MTGDDLREQLVAGILRDLGPALRALAGERLYVVAVTTDSDVMTARLVAHTDEAWQRLVHRQGATDAPEHRTFLRWWPDEWDAPADEPAPDDLVAGSRALAAAKDAAPDHDAWREHGRAVLDAALGDRRVRARIARHAPPSTPVLLVTDTDGPMRPTVTSIDRLNVGHPDPGLVAEARAWFVRADG